MPILNHSQGGPVGASTLLLIHPMGADSSFWDGCRTIWEAAFHCVAVDLRGAGGSPPATAPLTLETHAADLETLTIKLGLERVIPVGCAVGAMVAATYAARHPARCNALVLSNPGFRTRQEARRMLQRRAADVLAGGLAAVLPDAVDNAFAGCPQDDRHAAYLRRFASQDPISYAFQLQGILDADLSEDVTRIACSTLIVAGGADRLLPPHHAHQIHFSVARSKLVLVDKGAHFIPYQRPDEFAELVETFLRDVPDRVPAPEQGSRPRNAIDRPQGR